MLTITSAFDYIMCKRVFAAFKSKSSVIKITLPQRGAGGCAAVGMDDA
jgi:hypothetical protein